MADYGGPPPKKVATEKTQAQYSEANFIDLLKKISEHVNKKDVKKIVESLRLLAEFLCYSEQYKMNYYELLMTSDVLLVDMPQALAMDNKLITIQLLQSIQILVNFIKDPGFLTVLLGADIIR